VRMTLGRRQGGSPFLDVASQGNEKMVGSHSISHRPRRPGPRLRGLRP
jgi:hypothetical protein